MNARSSIFVDLARRSWIGPILGAMWPALFFVPLIISQFDLLSLTPFSKSVQDALVFAFFGAALLALILMFIVNQIASVRTQPARSGLSTFERIHARAAPPRSHLDLIEEPMEGAAPPAWMRALAAPVALPLDRLIGLVALAAYFGGFFLTLAPRSWVLATIGDDLAADIPRGLTALGLILLASLLLLRARCAEIVARSPSRRVRP